MKANFTVSQLKSGDKNLNQIIEQSINLPRKKQKKHAVHTTANKCGVLTGLTRVYIRQSWLPFRAFFARKTAFSAIKGKSHVVKNFAMPLLRYSDFRNSAISRR